MAEFMDFDPMTGLRYDYDYDDMSGNVSITTTQDVQAVLDYTKALANEGGTDKGIKKGWWLYAKVPAIVQLQMRAKGIRMDDPTATQRIIAEINENYPHLKCTQKHERGKPIQVIHDLGRK